MLQIFTRITAFTKLLEFEDYFKYFASRTYGVSDVISNLYDQIFAHPSFHPILTASVNFVQLLSDIKFRMPNATEYMTIQSVEVKHHQRFWKGRSRTLGTGILDNAYFFRLQVERSKGLTSSFEIAFYPDPLASFSKNIKIFCSKQEIEIGNCIEIGEPEELQNHVMCTFQQEMNSLIIPNSHRPWYLFVNEANIEAYEEALKYIVSNAYLGSE